MSTPIGLTCPQCGSTRIHVVDSRADEDAIRRRRKCKACGDRFTTYEMIADEMPTVGRAHAIRVDHALALVARLSGTLSSLRSDV